MAIVLDGTTGITSPAADFDGNVTLGSSVLVTPTGAAPSYTCRAWVNFNGTTNTAGFCTVRASGNVSSVADNGTCDYTINFATAMPDTNYAIAGAARITTSVQSSVVGYYGNGIVSTTQVQIRSPQLGTTGANYNDAETVSVAVFR
jgi:hypothetical protein